MKRISDLPGQVDDPDETQGEEEHNEGPEDLAISRGEAGEVEIRIPVQIVTKLGATLPAILGELADELVYVHLTMRVSAKGNSKRDEFIELVKALRRAREGRNFNVIIDHEVIEQLLAEGMSVDEFAAIMARNFHQRELQ